MIKHSARTMKAQCWPVSVAMLTLCTVTGPAPALPDLERSRSARLMPNAHISPPPAKSARRFMGGVGGEPLRPNMDSKPEGSIM